MVITTFIPSNFVTSIEDPEISHLLRFFLEVPILGLASIHYNSLIKNNLHSYKCKVTEKHFKSYNYFNKAVVVNTCKSQNRYLQKKA